jgi:uncharacterized protein YndB with AHSA1/START domain
MGEELDPILIQVTVPLPLHMIFSAFIDPAQLTGWLCDEAEVQPRLGGMYRLRFDSEAPFTSTGTITHYTPDLDIGFTWQGPRTFDALMNQPDSRTQVYVRLQESPEGIDVTLEHVGWVSGDSWEEARSWHFHLWDERLRRLKDYLMKVAYG